MRLWVRKHLLLVCGLVSSPFWVDPHILPTRGRAPSLRLPPLHFSFWKFLWGLLMEAYVTDI